MKVGIVCTIVLVQVFIVPGQMNQVATEDKAQISGDGCLGKVPPPDEIDGTLKSPDEELSQSLEKGIEGTASDEDLKKALLLKVFEAVRPGLETRPYLHQAQN